MLRLKPLFVGSAIALLLFGSALRATAQTVPERDQALLQLIHILTLQLQHLREQLAELQRIQDLPAPSFPTGATLQNIAVREGVLMPQVKLQARAVKEIVHGWVRDVEERQIGAKAHLSQGEFLRVLILIGNPDPNFIPEFSCERFGDWSGPVSFDQWVENVRPQGAIGVRCTTPDGQVSEDLIAVE